MNIPEPILHLVRKHMNGITKITPPMKSLQCRKQANWLHSAMTSKLQRELGISKKLKHAPFRLMLNLQHLENWDLTYADNNENTNVLNEAVQDTNLLDKIGKNILGFGDKFMRHATIGSEIIITDNFNIRLGYNYRRRKELGVSTKKGLNGFSFGIGIKVSKLHLSYGRAAYHLAGAPNYITLRTNFSEFSKKATEN